MNKDLIKNIQNLIGMDKLEQAIELMNGMLNEKGTLNYLGVQFKEISNSIMLLSSRIYSLKSRVSNGETLYEEASIERTKITKSLIHQVGLVEEIIELSFSNIETQEKKISKRFLKFLNATGVNFTHSAKETLTIEDLFVIPNIRSVDINSDKKTIQKVELVSSILDDSQDEFQFCLIGNEGSGKTTILKYLFRQYYNKGFTPIYISQSSVKSNAIKKVDRILERNFKNQYETEILFSDIPNQKIVLLFDDFHSLKLNNKYKKRLLDICCDRGIQKLIIAGTELLFIQNFIENLKEEYLLSYFDTYVISEFGSELRLELIHKWYSLDWSRVNDTATILRKNDFAKKAIDEIIGNCLIPSIPIYILSILQSLEIRNYKTEYNIHGFYYELLITSSLSKHVSDCIFRYLCPLHSGGLTPPVENYGFRH